MFLPWILLALSTLLLGHSLFTLFTMLFSWNDPETLHLRKSPKTYLPPKNTFSLLIPVRNEARVIKDTLRAMSKLRYPKALYEVFVLCRVDDPKTLDAIRATAKHLQGVNVRLLVVGENIDNKPKALNLGLSRANNDVIAVFDAEDEPHPDILSVIDTLMQQTQADVIQSGVQLMNYQSQWFSAFNVLEYYFWFKSALHCFTKMGVVPLGGNTVFAKREVLDQVNGWNETLLTEDADLGIRLSLNGAKIHIVYDEEHVTKEETPATVSQFVKQRTRWNQGFLQIFLCFEWLKLPGWQKKLLTAYLLSTPIFQALWVVYFPLTIFSMFLVQLPVTWALFTLLPGYVFLVQFVLYNYGMYEFTRDHRFPYSPVLILKLLLTYFPYQFLLSAASARAVTRLIQGEVGWEKTAHLNTHRNSLHAN